MLVEEHPADYLREDCLCRTSNACIVEQVALTVLGTGPQIVRQIPHNRSLVEALSRLQELYPLYNSAKLVLPSATGCKQLLQ